MKKPEKRLRNLGILILILLIINIVAAINFKRIDLTENHLYTLSTPSKAILEKADKPLFIQVFLKGDFPSSFRRLQNETRYLLEEYRAENPEIKFKFVNPLEVTDASPETLGNEFLQSGMPPQRLNIRKDGKNTQSLIFPWAIVSYGNKNTKVSLLKMDPEAKNSNEALVNKSVQNLEYAFSNAFRQLLEPKKKKIAIMRSHGELPDPNIASFLKAVGAYYHVGPFSLDSVNRQPQKVLQQLEQYDLLVEAKPTKPFSEKEKYLLDQYLMNGGKAIWLVDAVSADRDSLFINPKVQMLAYPRDLNLTDFFFKYGVRILPSLVNDLHADAIVLASGQGRQTQFKTFPWYYAPLVTPKNQHPIVKNIDPVRFDFANPMDTLKNGIQKTVLLKSSEATRVEGTPEIIDLDKTIGGKPNFETYRNGPQNLAVLLEGNFTSVYKNRVKPFSISPSKDKSPQTQILVVSDGDIIKNNIRKEKPTSLEYDEHTGRVYGNQEFLLNALNYMLDDSGLLNIRSKKVNIGMLSPQKIKQNKTLWQFITLGAPTLLLLLSRFLFHFYRKRKYTQKL